MNCNIYYEKSIYYNSLYFIIISLNNSCVDGGEKVIAFAPAFIVFNIYVLS